MARKKKTARPTPKVRAVPDALPAPETLGAVSFEVRGVDDDGLGGGNSRWDALLAVSQVVAAERRIRTKRDRLVRAARRSGASWADLARLLGVSPQAVQQRYGSRDATE